MQTNLFKLIADDLRLISRYKKKSAHGFFYGLLSPSFICTTIYRASHFASTLRIPILPRLIWWVNFMLFKVDIDQRAKLYCSLYLPHPMMIVIGKDTKIIGSAKIMQGVTIGGNLGRSALIDGSKITQPQLNGNFFLGANSIIAGPINLSGKVFVSGHAVCTKDAKDSVIYEKNQVGDLNVYHQEEISP